MIFFSLQNLWQPVVFKRTGIHHVKSTRIRIRLVSGGGVDPYACERRFMFVKCALHDEAEGRDVPRPSGGGKNRQSAGFSRGRVGSASLWEHRREEEQARETERSRTSLYFWAGECHGMREAKGP